MEFSNKEVRRQDRLLDEKRAMEIIKEGEYGILSMVSEDAEWLERLKFTLSSLPPAMKV